MDESQIITLNEKSQMKKSAHYMTPFIQKFRKCKLLYHDKKQISGLLGMGQRKFGGLMVCSLS